LGDPVSFVIALSVGLVLTPAARWAGLALGIVDRPIGDELKIHSRPTSLLGGVAAITSVVLAEGLVGRRFSWFVAAAVGLSLLVGLLDDVFSLRPILRVALIAAAGGILAAGSVDAEGVGVVLALGVILLVLACDNAVNIVDGQDGLAGGVAALAALGAAGVLALLGDGVGASLGLALAGALLAFLVWNRPPARIFLGDGGAYAVGTLLAVLAVRAAQAGGFRGLLAVGAALGILAFEVGFSVVRRLVSGAQLAGGDRLHSYDLAAYLWGRTGSTLTFWALGTLCAAAALAVAILPLLAGALLLGTGLLLGGAWGIWLRSKAASGARGSLGGPRST
jgi:UDP-GlcNAc:undecaprenyl-phosphate/decaprenyl-phosphate GlcNAc-1-phosphate transferase